MSEEVAPSFMKALLSLSLHGQAEGAINNVSNMYDDFVKSYTKLDETFDITLLAGHPLLHALRNRVKSIIKDIQMMKFKPEISLMDCLDMMRIESVDKLVSLKRDPKSVVDSLDKLWRSSYYKLKHLTYEQCGGLPEEPETEVIGGGFGGKMVIGENPSTIDPLKQPHPITMFPDVASFSPEQWYFQIPGYKPWGAIYRQNLTQIKNKLDTLGSGLNPDKELNI